MSYEIELVCDGGTCMTTRYVDSTGELPENWLEFEDCHYCEYCAPEVKREQNIK